MEGEPDDEGMARTAGVGHGSRPGTEPPATACPGLAALARRRRRPIMDLSAGPIAGNGVVVAGVVSGSESPWSSRWLPRWWWCR